MHLLGSSFQAVKTKIRAKTQGKGQHNHIYWSALKQNWSSRSQDDWSMYVAWLQSFKALFLSVVSGSSVFW